MDPNTLNRPKYLLHISYAFFSNIKHAKRSFKKKKKKFKKRTLTRPAQ